MSVIAPPDPPPIEDPKLDPESAGADPEALIEEARERARRRHRRSAVALALVLAGVAAYLAFGGWNGRPSPRIAGADPAQPLVANPSSHAVPEVDYILDLNTGVMTPLPEPIIRSVADTSASDVGYWLERHRYAASPDGARLAYVGTGDDGNRQIFIAAIDGTGLRQVTHDPTGTTSPAWSPDGNKIAYLGFGGADARTIFVLDVTTGESRQIATETPVHEWAAPQFTPDGSSLAYTAGTPYYPVLVTVPLAGGKSTVLVGPGEGVTDAGNGSISPDGSLVTFLGSGEPDSGPGHCGPCRFVANADGTQRRVIPGWIANPAGTWSPDGSRIVSLGMTEDRIIVVDVQTGTVTRSVQGQAAIWLDPHTLLVDANEARRGGAG